MFKYYKKDQNVLELIYPVLDFVIIFIWGLINCKFLESFDQKKYDHLIMLIEFLTPFPIDFCNFHVKPESAVFNYRKFQLL